MSSVANNHGTFGQQSLIPPQKASSTSAIPMAFYKRDATVTPNPECYPLDGSVMRPRQPDYPGWSPLPNLGSTQWADISCDSTAPHVGSLPAAHSLLSHTAKGNAPTTTPSVMTNQNGKTFTAPSTSGTPVGNFHGYEDQHQHFSPTGYQLKRGSSYSGPRPTFLDNSSTSNVIQHMEYADGQGDPYQAKSNPAFHTLTADMPFNSYRYHDPRDEKAGVAKMTGHFQSTVEPMSVSPSASLRSSDGETTASSSATRGATSLSVTGSLPTGGSTAGVTAASVMSTQPKRPRKPAPTLATGRRNLKSEPVS